MAATGFTPISLYYSATASAVPLAANLVAGELALNTNDGKLYYKNSSNVVTLLAAAAAATGTVSSVAQSFTGGLISVTGSPITTSGTLALTVAGTSGGIPYFSSASTWATSAALTANAIVLGGGAGAAPATTTTGTGVVTALGVNTGSAGAFVVNGGALGTPSGGTLTNATGLPISTGVSGLGASVATALGVAVGTAGSFVVNGGVLGTPSSGTLTNCTFPTLNQNTSGTAGGLSGTPNITVGTIAGGNTQLNSLGINTAASGTAGEIRATNNITAYYSDDRLKTKLGNIQDALAKVKTLSGFYYKANQTAQNLGYEVVREVGVSAQQVQAVLPEVVVPAPIDEKYWTVRYEKLIPLLIEAIKELDAKIEGLVKA